MNVRKLWPAVILGVLLVMSLAGEAGARERTAVNLRKYITIPAAHFNPNQDGLDWYNEGRRLYLDAAANYGTFIAPVVFPGSGPVTIRKITLYAYDNNGAEDIGATLYKTSPSTGAETEMACARSTGASTTNPREFSDITITYATIQRTHGVYLAVYFPARSNLEMFGVKIAYVD